MSGWPAAVDQLGLELEAAIARRQGRPGWRRLPRFVPAIVVGLLAAAATAVGTTGLIREGIPVPWSSGEKATALPLPLEPTRAADPAGGPPWGIRLSKSGPLLCATVGQVMGGRIGIVRGRTFHALPASYHDNCAHVSLNEAIVRWAQYPGANVGEHDARTVVYGVAGRGVVQVEVVGRRVSRALTPSSRGAFVSAYDGLLSPRDLRVRVTRDDGATKLYGGGR